MSMRKCGRMVLVVLNFALKSSTMPVYPDPVLCGYVGEWMRGEMDDDEIYGVFASVYQL